MRALPAYCVSNRYFEIGAGCTNFQIAIRNRRRAWVSNPKAVESLFGSWCNLHQFPNNDFDCDTRNRWRAWVSNRKAVESLFGNWCNVHQFPNNDSTNLYAISFCYVQVVVHSRRHAFAKRVAGTYVLTKGNRRTYALSR